MDDFETSLTNLKQNELRAMCKRHNLSAAGTKAELRDRLRTLPQQPVITEQPHVTSSSVSIHETQSAETTVIPQGKVNSIAEGTYVNDDLHDTAGSPEHAETQCEPAAKGASAAAINTRLPKQFSHAAPTSPPDEIQQAVRQPFQRSSQHLPAHAQPQQAVPYTNEQAAEAPGLHQEGNRTLQQSAIRYQYPALIWSLPTAISFVILAWSLARGTKPSTDTTVMCQQTRDVEPLAQLLISDDAKTSLAELWRGEGLVPHKAGGVLLACSDPASCSAAATAVAMSLPPNCSHCLHHFLPRHGNGYSSTAVERPGPEVAGQAQKDLVARLQQCSHAVVTVNNIDAVPTAVLPVLITALSEQGQFEHSGKQIDTTKALFVGILQVPATTLQQEDEEALARAVKQHLVQKLKERGAGRSLGAEAGSQTEPLRGRFGYVAEVRLSNIP